MAIKSDDEYVFNPYMVGVNHAATGEQPLLLAQEQAMGADAFATGGGSQSASSGSWHRAGADSFMTGGAPTSGDHLRGVDSLVYVPGHRLLGRYQLADKIGEGGMGEVWRAFDLVGQRDVAIKRIHPMMLCDGVALKRFARECELLARLSHPSIVGLYERHLAYGFFAMELLKGKDLAAWQSRVRRFSLMDCLDILGQLVQGLAVIHAEGLIHRDIKPTNLQLVRHQEGLSWQVKLLDFGIAWSSEGQQLTATRNSLLGSPYYIAPELLHGSASPSPKVDVYSLGVLLYELFTGEIPLAGALSLEESATQMLARGWIGEGECTEEMRLGYLRLLRQEATQLMRGALAREPSQRSSLAAFSAGLEQLKQSYRALRGIGQRRRHERIQQFLLAGCFVEAEQCLEEAAALYPESRTWARLGEQMRREQRRLVHLRERLWSELRSLQTRRHGYRRRRDEAKIRQEWEDAVSKTAWPQMYRNDPFNLQVNPPSSNRNVRIWQLFSWRGWLEPALVLLIFVAFAMYLMW